MEDFQEEARRRIPQMNYVADETLALTLLQGLGRVRWLAFLEK